MEIGRECPMCRDYWTKELDVTVEKLEKFYEKADLIQNIFPNLEPREREFIKTGYCYDCQSLIFGGAE